jgi:CubicO group peptidase (beta-lactamase class C family)/Tol biopolymer transport system component/poly(3-hydroxybutyrate) depolymerase
MRRTLVIHLALMVVISARTADSAAQDTKSATPPNAAPSESLKDLDPFIDGVMKEWKLPGLAIAVVKDGKVIHANGYGFRDAEKQLPVTPKTVFAIGSISKSFTATGLGMLVDDGKLDWDKPVRSYIHDFQLQDKIASEQITPRDLVTHRSGLPRHDFVWYGDSSISRNDLFARLRYLEPSKEFRSTWQYQNLMFMTAGILAEHLSSSSWEDFTRTRIIEPLGMDGTNFSVNDSQKADDFALPYSKVKDEFKPVPFHNIDAVGPAGSINSNVEAMIKYVQFHIAKGKHGDRQLLSAAQAEQLQTPQMVMPANPLASAGEELGDMSYGMGLMVSSYRGTKYVEHGGGIDGFISLLSFLPRKKAGVIVLTNMSGANPVPTIVTRRVYDLLLGMEPIDWAGRIRTQQNQAKGAAELAKKTAATARKEGTSPSHPLEDYAGSYDHPAYGTVKVELDGSVLRVTTGGGLTAPLHHYHYDIFESDDDPAGRFNQQKLTFSYNKRGEIDRVAVAFEPAVSDIVFTRVADPQLRERAFLEKLIGTYGLGLTPLVVALKNETTLTMTIPGQPTYELAPARGMTFDLKGLNGYSAQFKKDDTGVFIELVLFQPNGTFVAKRKPPAATIASTPDGKRQPASPSVKLKPPVANGHTADTAPAPTAWSPELMINVRRVSGVRVSPDGKRVAYQVGSPVMTDDKSEILTQLFVVNADGTGTMQLTFGEKSSTDPQWSPDGNSLGFLSDRAGKKNLYLIRLAGGEAEQLTDVKSGVAAFEFSPDGKHIAFTMPDPPSDAEEKSAKTKDDAKWFERDWKFARLYVIPVERPDTGKREPRKLTTTDYHVGMTGRTTEGGFDWSPDSRSIAFTHQKTPKANEWPTADVSIVDVASGEVKPLAKSPAAEMRPVFSPDGKWVAMTISDQPARWAGSRRIQIISAMGDGEPRVLAATFDGQPNLVGWSANGSVIYFSEARGTTDRVYSIDARTSEISDVVSANQVLTSIDLNPTGTTLGFAMESSDRPVEAFVTRVAKFEPVQVSRANADLPNLLLGKVELVRWKSTDGYEIEGLLTYPVGYEPGKRVPLILNIHGGPAGVFSQKYIAASGLYPLAAFSARGYAVLQPNPRGSSGYGPEFRYANHKDWGGGDFQDLMAGVDHVIQMGVADPDRLGVCGWSYGGYMTSWVITQTKRFKAASIGAPVTNLISFNGTADIPNFIPDYFGSQPWDDVELMRARSPVLNAKGVTTPALIQHGDADVRVPISQGYEYFNALKQQGVPVEMLVLPRQPHGPTEPKMILKVMQTNLEWFDKHLGAKSPESTAGSDSKMGSPSAEAIDDFIQSEMQKRHIPGLSLAIVRHGEIVTAKGFGHANVELGVPVAPETVFQLQSISKTFTAAAILMLVEEGKIGLDDNITKHLDNLPEAWSDVTVRQLLSHTSGIKDFINEPTVNLRLDATPDEIVKSLADKPLNFPPGEKFKYSNTGYQLLGMIIHKITRKAWGEFLCERIFEPLGMKNTRVINVAEIIPNRATGYRFVSGTLQNGGFVAPSILAYPGGGVRSTALDLAKWDAALCSEKLLKKSTLDQMWTPAKLNDGTDAPYGLGWFVGKHQGRRFVLHTGSHVTGFGTVLARYVDDQLTVIALTNQNSANPSEIAHGIAARVVSGSQVSSLRETPAPQSRQP